MMAHTCCHFPRPDSRMRPLLHPSLVNGRWGDPALYVETMYERDALLFDLGDITSLPPRKVHRLTHVFVSHAHIDHFVGFDYLLRVLAGRDKRLALYGPEGFIAHVQHKLMAYRWNLVDSYANDLVLSVTEIGPAWQTQSARFRLKTGFAAEATGERQLAGAAIVNELGFRVSAAILEHRIPCLAFAVEEAGHVNVWKNRLSELGLPVGPWLRQLKRAVIEGKPDDAPIVITGDREGGNRALPLSALRQVLTLTPGQKIAYVTDAADTPANRGAIIDLVRHADLLFIEAAFAANDAHLAMERAHLTTTAAGEIARQAQARRIEPFHFSARYNGQEALLIHEVMAAFGGGKPDEA
jgi:ribonuclease Z